MSEEPPAADGGAVATKIEAIVASWDEVEDTRAHLLEMLLAVLAAHPAPAADAEVEAAEQLLILYSSNGSNAFRKDLLGIAALLRRLAAERGERTQERNKAADDARRFYGEAEDLSAELATLRATKAPE